MIGCVLLVSCSRDDSREQKITIKIDSQPGDLAAGNAEYSSGSPDRTGSTPPVPDRMAGQKPVDKSVPDLLKQLVDRLDDVKPILQKLTEDEACRSLISQGDSQKLADYLIAEHLGSLSEITVIMGAKDRTSVAGAVARHLIRKAETGRRSGPVSPRHTGKTR